MNIGDLVKITENQFGFPVGTVCQIDGVNDTRPSGVVEYSVVLKDRHCVQNSNGLIPWDFQKGDRVVVVEDNQWIPKGRTGVVTNTNNGVCGIEVLEDGKTQPWWMYRQQLEKPRDIKVDDYVEIIGLAVGSCGQRYIGNWGRVVEIDCDRNILVSHQGCTLWYRSESLKPYKLSLRESMMAEIRDICGERGIYLGVSNEAAADIIMEVMVRAITRNRKCDSK